MAVRSGAKTHEWRKNDRDFQVCDLLELAEFDPFTNTYTGRKVNARVTYITAPPAFAIPEGYCVMSITTEDPA